MKGTDNIVLNKANPDFIDPVPSGTRALKWEN